MSLFFSVTTLLLMQDAQSWPALPDFKSNVDYAAWYVKLIEAGVDPEENACEIYRRIFPSIDDHNAPTPEGLRFAGFRHDDNSRVANTPAPWDPAEHPAWEESYQRTKRTLDVFRDAAAKPYYSFPVQIDQMEPAWRRSLLWGRVLPHTSPLRACGRGLSEAAWRAPAGRIDTQAFLLTCESRLNVARQMDREQLLILSLSANRIRESVYEDLRFALHHDVFTPVDRAGALSMLARSDGPVAPFEAGLAFECAAMLDLLQAMTTRATFGGVKIDAARYREYAQLVVPISESGPEWPSKPTGSEIREIDARKTAEAIHDNYKQIAELARQGYPEVRAEQLYEQGAKCARLNGFTRRFLGNLAGGDVRLTCTVAERRATRLILAIHIFHDEHGRWPTALSELPTKLVSEFGDDPFTGKPLTYRIVESEPLLYTVGCNCRDDDGQHNPKWKSDDVEPPDGDGVFWPVPLELE